MSDPAFATAPPVGPRVRPFFLACQDGSRRFGLHHPAQGGAVRARVLYLHPLAEEMNRSRRMAALQARALAAAGCEVLQIDLLGCGDSDADFADASWQGWVDDALEGCAWLRAQPGTAPTWLWGLRAGALLAVEAACALDAPCNLLLWQPPASGRAVLQQFLRLRLAEGLSLGDAGTLMKTLRRQLDAGQAVQAAGYALAPALARGLEAATLAPPARAGRLAWLEVGDALAEGDGAVSPAAQPVLQAWRAAGWQVHARRVPGPAFWTKAEIETAPALQQATLQALLDEVPA